MTGRSRSHTARSATALETEEAVGEHRELEAIAEASRPVGTPARVVPPFGMALGRVVRVDDAEVEVEVGGRVCPATVDPAVHASVVETARARGERVLVAADAEGHLAIVGALRTQPTPGVDAMDTIRLEARRVEITGAEEVQLRSGIATLALRAVGEVETYADRIVSRAEEVQKIIGRMLRLN